MSVPKTTRRERRPSFSYDIAFSFAEENRGFVERVAELLRNRKVKVYYDEHERIYTWGQDLRQHLHNVYLNEARFCMIFISAQYKRKYWTQYEQDRVKARSLFSKEETYILPFKLDDTDIAGITDTLAYLTVEKLNEEQLAEAILEKINTEKKTASPLWYQYRKFFAGRIRLGVTMLTVTGCLALGLSVLQAPDTVSSVTRQLKQPDGQTDHTAGNKIKPLLEQAQRQGVKKEWHFTAVCKDGWLSQSTHRTGTCSWHGGVDHWIDTVVYSESMEQCRDEAMQAFQARNK